MNCIFCKLLNSSKSIEHIVSESLGNDFYVMPRNSVCDDCNSKFAKFEGKALTNTIFLMERANLAVITKKRKTVKGKIENLKIQGDPEFKSKHVIIEGLEAENVISYNSETKEMQILVKSFDKSEEATAKLLLKVALESIYKSQNKQLYNKYNFDELRDYVLGVKNLPWPFVITDYEPDKFKSIPTYTDKYELVKRRMRLEYNVQDNQTLLFRFNYNGIQMVINLLNRKTDWIIEFQNNDPLIQINPEKTKNKLQIQIE